MKSKYDIVIVGAGHNGLVAACYLAGAGKSVLMLERNLYVGGATTSQRIFPDYDAYLSRYSYLVSLFPQQIVRDLRLSLELRRRRTASYTPFWRGPEADGLLLSNINEAANRNQIERLHPDDYKGYLLMQQRIQRFTDKVWPSLLLPLDSKEAWKNRFREPEDRAVWEWLVEKPLGEFIEAHLQHDVLRGVVLTDAKISANTHAHDPSLLQNRTFLYHVIGNQTGEWRVPVGGMGALADALYQQALRLGVEVLTGAEVLHIHPHSTQPSVTYKVEDKEVTIQARQVLVNAAPAELKRLVGPAPVSRPPDGRPPVGRPQSTTAEQEGTAFKVNMLLHKLPPLRSGIAAEDAFAGTFHFNQTYTGLAAAFEQSQRGQLPERPPFEIYCHTLTDNSILSSELQRKGYHTITIFGLDAPYSLFLSRPEQTRQQLLNQYLATLNEWFTEPIQDCIARQADGTLCLEAKSALDLETELQLPRGNIFHSPLSWFYAEDTGGVGQRGVETDFAGILLCGSGAERGGAVSGIPGYHAAMKLLNQELR
ncbi:NAD(P)/FAD-dependent oxidoreductase [Telluribacter sp.]|jgi:phytoene dehydrogenase-like protein|uniref:phytoene desaturase family protein n=1 Tax=Telluribacter sp. TaxID=1978767 RepID=UPI002E15B328|nr:NAD(P)/FAD-dependent oxidoreductase [Telluribacter sp.]